MTQLDKNKILLKAIGEAMALAEKHISEGFYSEKYGQKRPKITGLKVARALGYSFRKGHSRVISAAYNSVFFNENLK